MTRINDIRSAYFDEGRNISEIAALFKIDRKTARKYIERDDFNLFPPVRPKGGNRWPKLEPYVNSIDEWLEGDVKARKKQRHTARRVYERLKEAHPDFDCSYRTREEARLDIFKYIEIFYNRKRLHSGLGYKSPETCEKERLWA